MERIMGFWQAVSIVIWNTRRITDRIGKGSKKVGMEYS